MSFKFIFRKNSILIWLFLVSFLIRLFIFFFIWEDLRHGSANISGSAAIGLTNKKGLTFNELEINKIASTSSNFEGDYSEYYNENDREVFTIFLPGPPFLLFILWKLVPIYNFLPYIMLQIIIDCFLIVFFYWEFSKLNSRIALLTSFFIIINLPTIQKVLMMGYDFWPQYHIMITFIYSLIIFRAPERKRIFFIFGILTSITFWFRDITSFLPVFIVFYLLYFFSAKTNFSFRQIFSRILFYIVPVLISMFLLSGYRYYTTGNFRPTRSTFWHTFFAGVGQFQNPYGISNDDKSVWKYAQKINPLLSNFELDDMYKLPDSPYELTLKKQAKNFIHEYPFVFIRNTFYRISFMISPLLYKDAKFIPKAISKVTYPGIGILLLLLWIIGLFKLFENRSLFWLIITIYIYFFISFGWFYINGRVILPFMFLNIILYLNGTELLYKRISRSLNRNLLDFRK